MPAEPFSGVPVQLDIEAVTADPVEASEGDVELFRDSPGSRSGSVERSDI